MPIVPAELAFFFSLRKLPPAAVMCGDEESPSMPQSRMLGPVGATIILDAAVLWEKRQSLAVQPGKLHDNPKTFAIGEIEDNNFVPGNTVKIAVGTKAQTARPAKFGQAFGTKDAHEAPIGGVVLANRGHRIRHSKRILAGYDNVAVGRDGQIERTEFGVVHQP